jgi:hypothetical protein
MSNLMARIELQKLAGVIDLQESDLGYLAHLGADQLRELRETVSTALYSRHESRFGRMAAVSKLVPAAISAKASGLVGPALSAQVAGALDPQHAVKLAKAMKPSFLADVTTYLDPGRVTEIVKAMPPGVVVPVGQTLLKRKEFLTLGRFTSVVDPDTALAASEGADGMGLLHLALYTEDRSALDAIVTRIDDERLGTATAAAAASGEYDEALALMEVLSPANRARVIEEAAKLNDTERNDLIAGVIRNDAWAMLLEPLDKVSHDALKKVLNVPVTAEAAVFDVVLDQAIKADRTEVFEAILLALDGAHVTALSASKVLSRSTFKKWVSKTPGMAERLSGVLAKVS